MRQCTDCKTDKPLEEFAHRSAKCKLCHRAYNKKHYLANKDYYIEKARRNGDKYIKSIQTWLWEYLQEHSCIDCGESDPIVLEFDHRDDVNKVFNISSQVRQGIQLARIIDEVAKCDVRCANCHHRRTAKQQGWWKLALSKPL